MQAAVTPRSMDEAPRQPAFGTPPIASEKIVSERKIFFIDLKENNRGRYLKITEDVGGRRDTIMMPVPALGEFIEALTRIATFEKSLDGDRSESS
jgi:hypothetical protein